MLVLCMTLFWGRPAPGARWTQYLRAGYFELHMAKHDEEKLLFFLKWWKPIAQRKDKTVWINKKIRAMWDSIPFDILVPVLPDSS